MSDHIGGPAPDRTQMLSVEKVLDSVGRLGIRECNSIGLTKRMVEEARAALSQPEHQGDTDDLCLCGHVRHEHHTRDGSTYTECAHCACESFALERPRAVEEAENAGLQALMAQRITSGDYWDLTADFLRNLASREQGGEEKPNLDDMLRPASRAHLSLVAAVLKCLETGVWPETIRRFVDEEIEEAATNGLVAEEHRNQCERKPAVAFDLLLRDSRLHSHVAERCGLSDITVEEVLREVVAATRSVAPEPPAGEVEGLREHLAWAIAWIEQVQEVPLAGEEGEPRKAFEAAKAAISDFQGEQGEKNERAREIEPDKRWCQLERDAILTIAHLGLKLGEAEDRASKAEAERDKFNNQADELADDAIRAENALERLVKRIQELEKRAASKARRAFNPKARASLRGSAAAFRDVLSLARENAAELRGGGS